MKSPTTSSPSGWGAGDGAFKIFTSATTHVIVDVTGYYAPPGNRRLVFPSAQHPGALARNADGLHRLLRAGDAAGPAPGDPNANPNLDLPLQGRSPIPSPCNSIPATAQVLVGNATSVLPSGGGYLTIYPSGGSETDRRQFELRGRGCDQRAFRRQVWVRTASSRVYTFASTHLVIDILGYYSEDASGCERCGVAVQSSCRVR